PRPDPQPPRAGNDLPKRWKFLNTYALDHLDLWVPRLFPTATKSKRGYRVSSAALGRNLEEDISFTRDGIVDFGVHDMGDANQGRRTAIDIVQEWNRCDFEAAVRWLCQALGLDARDYLPGEKKRTINGGGGNGGGPGVGGGGPAPGPGPAQSDADKLLPSSTPTTVSCSTARARWCCASRKSNTMLAANTMSSALRRFCASTIFEIFMFIDASTLAKAVLRIGAIGGSIIRCGGNTRACFSSPAARRSSTANSTFGADGASHRSAVSGA